MVDRAASVARTRATILDAAAELFAGHRYAEVSLGDIAEAAGVSRGTVYHQFGSRQGLIEALTSATEQRADFERVMTAAGGEEPGPALVATCVEIVRFVHHTAPLFDNLRSLAQVDTELREMVERKDTARRDLVEQLVSRVAEVAELRVPPARAVAVVTTMTHYEAVRELLIASTSLDEAREHARWAIQQLLHTAE